MGDGCYVLFRCCELGYFISVDENGCQTDSVALEADALHLRTDVYTSAGVAGGLFLLWITGIQLFDPLIAIGVALLIIKAAYDLVKAFSPLLDGSLPEEEEAGDQG